MAFMPLQQRPSVRLSARIFAQARSTVPNTLRYRRPGTENDDHNPPRIAPRNLFDLAIGHDNLFHGDRYRWSARFTVINVADKVALYNFLSTFSGTHYVTPRAMTEKLASIFSSLAGQLESFPAGLRSLILAGFFCASVTSRRATDRLSRRVLR